MGGRESLFGEGEGELCGEMKKEMARVFHALANFSFFNTEGSWASDLIQWERAWARVLGSLWPKGAQFF